MARVLLIPATMMLGGYRLGKQLGAGGMGVVYDGVTPDGAHVAVKILRRQRREEPESLARFHDEAIAGRIASHPHLVSVIDHGEIDGTPFLVMPLIAGDGLGTLVRTGGALSLPRATQIALQILDGLAALHAADVVHADVKSDNILVTGEHATLIDFGLACIAGVDRTDHRAKLVLGTPEYMAPELAWGACPTAASDIYAVGCLLYELVTGTTPFCGGSSSDVLRRQIRDPVVPPSLRNPDGEIPAALERVMLHALAKQAPRRFDSALEFRDTLAIARHTVTSDRSGTFATRAVTLDLPRASPSATTVTLEPVHAA